MVKNSIKSSLIRKGIVHIEHESQYHLTTAFMRLQEYYESPFDEFRGKFFKHESFFDRYAGSTSNKEFSYFTDWCGFNIPGYIARSFYDKFKDKDMWDKEIQLFEAIIKTIGIEIWSKNRDFYIIGSHKGEDQKQTIRHELAHAYWCLYPEYKKNMHSFLQNEKYITRKQYNNMCHSLKSLGYDTGVYEDEMQAFLSAGNNYEILCKLRPGLGFKRPICFRRYFNKFDKDKA